MAFQIPNKQASGKQVKWRFENTENIFTSDVERFRRNVQFWMKKLNMAPTTQVELLEGAQWVQDHLAEEKNIVDVDHEIVEETNLIEETNDTDVTDSPAIEPSGDEPIAESSVAQAAEDIVDTPKPKSRKKAADL